MKNPTTQVTRAAKTLNASFKVGLTGTPVENRLHDLWSISDVVWPGFLGASKEFVSNYSDDSAEDIEQLKLKVAPEPNSSIIPFLVRRMKKDRIEDLPDKRVNQIECEMPEAQARTYHAVVSEAICRKNEGVFGKGGMLKTIQKLRAVSLHPESPKGVNISGGDQYGSRSARLSATLDVLKEIETRQEKVLIFLESLDLQEWLAGYLKVKFKLSRRPDIINGSVSGVNRQRIVDSFQAQSPGFDIMILSPKAGGVGLTLTAANNVIHLSRWWNPAIEDQSTDRVYRIGQEKPVNVYIPLAIHPDNNLTATSFDLRLNALLDRKRNLSQNLLAPANPGQDPLQELFGSVIQGASAIDTPKTANSERDTICSGEINSTSSETNPLNPPVKERRAAWKNHFPKILTAPAGQVRPASEAFEHLKLGKLKTLFIQDPYCATRRNRDHLINFITQEIFDRGGLPNTFILSFYGPQDRHVAQQFGGESVRRVKSEIWEGLFHNHAPHKTPKFEPRPVHRPRDEAIHDRVMRFMMEIDGEIATFRLTMDNGIDVWQDESRQITSVNIAVEDNAIWNTI